MKVDNNISIQAPVNKVWKILAEEFDQAGNWMAAIPSSHAIETGEKVDTAPMVGRVCQFSTDPNGGYADERITYYDSSNYEMHVNVVPKNVSLPIEKNSLQIKLEPQSDNMTLVKWVSDVELKTIGKLMYPALKMGVNKNFREILEELKFYVENGKPHPRKIKAMN